MNNVLKIMAAIVVLFAALQVFGLVVGLVVAGIAIYGGMRLLEGAR